jgi:SAM-dependent methyltransferase
MSKSLSDSDSPVLPLTSTAIRPDIALAGLALPLMFYDSPTAKLVRRPLNNSFYTVTCRKLLPTELMTFLNFGYLADRGELSAEDGEDIVDRMSEGLYDRVVGDIDLRGKTVAEIGCGPGAGCAHLARAYAPGSIVGVDLNKEMVAWCRAHHEAPNLEFLQGDALDLPFASDSLDAIVNIESSHGYPSKPPFFAEVARVLRPGGRFLYADIMLRFGKRHGPDVLSAHLKQVGLEIDSFADITQNVLAARDAVTNSPAFRSLLRERVSIVRRPVLEQGLCFTGSKLYKLMTSGRLCYGQWQASKPNPAG